MILKAIFLLLLRGILAEDVAKTQRYHMPAEQEFTHGPIDAEPTGTELGNVTILDMKAERTTIPESDIDDALNLDYGRYTPMHFQYYNDQNKFLKDGYTDDCANQWIKCLLTMSQVQIVCAEHDFAQKGSRGLTLYANYCDMYYDNCRNINRYWRIVDIGDCWYGQKDKFFHLEFPRRTISKIWDFFNPKNNL